MKKNRRLQTKKPTPISPLLIAALFLLIVAVIYIYFSLDSPVETENANPDTSGSKTIQEATEQKKTEKQMDAHPSAGDELAKPAENKKLSETDKVAAPKPSAAQDEFNKYFKDSDSHVVSGVIKGSLYGSFNRCFKKDKESRLISEKAAAHFKRIFLFDINFKKDVLRGDRFAFAYTLTPTSTDEMRILAAVYESKKFKKTFEAVFYQGADVPLGKHYAPNGTERQKSMKNCPLKDYEIVSAVLKDRRPRHDGIDFKAPEGTPIFTPWKAVVQRKNWRTRNNGQCLDIKYPGKGINALFLHLESIAEKVKPGKVLPAGTQIATVGNTGRSYAPHLHYQLMSKKGKVIDPYIYHGSFKKKAPAEVAKKVAALWKNWSPKLKNAIEHSGTIKN